MIRILVLLLCLSLVLPARAEPRIVSVAGALTETVYLLGAGHLLVGVDTTSQHPPEARALPSVGYMRQLSAEGILSLAPTLVVATADAGPPAVLAQLRAATVAVMVLPSHHDVASLEARILGVGEAVGRPQAARELAHLVTDDIRRLGERLASVGRRPRVLFLLAAGQTGGLASGTGTAADAMIRLAGGENAIRGYEGYKPLTAEGAVGAAPDVILFPSHAAGGLGGREGVLRLPGIATTPAARAGRVLQMDSLALLGFGPRMAVALRDLAAELHPDVALPELGRRP